MTDTRSCPVCMASRTLGVFGVREMMYGDDESFSYAQCADCRSVFIMEVPSNLADYYSERYYSFKRDPQVVMGRPGVAQALSVVGRSILFGRRLVGVGVRRALPVRQAQTVISLFESVRLAGLSQGQQSRLLDVGSGSGDLVYALSLTGLSVTGVDPFGTDRAFDTGATLRNATIDDLDDEFDLIMMHHALEHVPDPHHTMTRVRELLAPGGRVLVRMPTVSSEAFDRYGAKWMQLDPPRHLTLFSRIGMQRLCSRAGLVVRQAIDDSTGFQFWASEQAQVGTALVSPSSHFVDPRSSRFSRTQIRAWDREANALNRAGRGDQVAWVLIADEQVQGPFGTASCEPARKSRQAAV